MSMSSPERMVHRGRELLNGFTLGQKVISVLVAGGLVLGAMFFMSWAKKPEYVPLFSNLAATDASAITQKLSSSGAKYQLADGGQTVLVPKGDVYTLRVEMAGDGLPAGGEGGYSLLDKQGITTSDFQQHVTYQRALEGELTKTIMAMDGVAGASVHLVVPSSDVFSDAGKPSASVLIRSNATITSDEVSAIVHLVSSSVEGLTPDQVTVADAAGRLLSAAGEDTGSEVGGTQAERTDKYERDVEGDVQQMVDSLVGPGHAVVRVNAALDFSKKTTKSSVTTVTPSSAPQSVSTSKETYTGNGTGAGGPLGTTTGPTTGTGSGANKYSKQTDTRDNPSSTTETTTVSAPGTPTSVKVAVLLDTATAKKVNLGRLKTLVGTAAGVVPTRGDTVTVDAMPFDQTTTKAAKAAQAKEQSSQQMATYMSLAKTLLVLLFLGLVLFLAMRNAKKNTRRVGLSAEEIKELEDARRVLVGGQPAAVTAGDGRAIEAGARAELSIPDQRAADEAHEKRLQMRDEIADVVDRQPAEVAALLRGWLADRRS